jgi:TldD protein
VVAVGEGVFASPEAADGPTLDRLAADVCARVEKRIAVRDAPTGPQAVVFAPGVGGILVHEIVGHALEGDVAGTSWLSGRKERLAPAGVVVVDDPRRSRVPWQVDDEGERSRPTPLILEGKVRGRLLDQSSAAACGMRSTGHGRCASFREPIRPRMGCTFLAAGSSFPAEVREGVDGIYVRRMESASTDPRTGRATFRVTDADLLSAGRAVGALRPHLLRVDGATALATLDRVGKDLTFDTCVGSCHRDGQALSISVGAPTFRIGVAHVVA